MNFEQYTFLSLMTIFDPVDYCIMWSLIVNKHSISRSNKICGKHFLPPLMIDIVWYGLAISP